MGQMTGRQRRIVRALKGLEPEGLSLISNPSIPIIDGEGSRIGSLQPLDRRLADDEEIIASLTRWRRRAGRFFFTRFEPSDERTRGWLDRVVLADDTRILFLVTDAEGRPVGNLGACNVTEDGAELDNYIRGERGGDPRLMLLSGLSLAGWLYAALNVEKIHSRVLADNSRVLALYEATGCFQRGEIEELVPEMDGSGDTGDHAPREWLRFVRMTLDVQEFLSRYPWMARAG